MQHRIDQVHWSRTTRALAVSLSVVVVAVTVGAAGIGSGPPVISAAALAQVEIDTSKVQGIDKCTDCHAGEVDAWKKTKHSTTWTAMNRNENAPKIIEALGLGGRIKTNDLCYQCHYTAQIVEGERKAISGVSCESCHGAARDWTSEALHHETAGKAEGAAKEAIYKQCEAAGMLRPANVYNVARNCFSCHTVPNERLVNVGGHTAGSSFELVSWSQGEVRHNYVHANGKENRKASPERLRVLYVVGALTDLEYGLRGISKATTKGPYVAAMVTRVNRALATLDEIAKAKIPEVADALAAVPRREDGGGVKVSLNSAATMATVAASVSAAAEKFSSTNDGASLDAIDALLPRKVMGTAQP